MSMHITVAMELGVDAVLYIGMQSKASRRGKPKYVTINEISETCGLSENHLTKVIYKLGQTGIIRTIRGRNGGIVLGKPLDEITLRAVLRAFRHQSSQQIVQSFRKDVQALIEPSLQEAFRKYEASLDETTFEELVERFGNRKEAKDSSR